MKLKYILLIAFVFFTQVSVFSQEDVRQEICLNGMWNFKSDADSEWTKIRVPSAYTGVQRYWGEEHWDCFDYPEHWIDKGAVYERDFTLPDNYKEKHITFYCGGAYHHTELYVNGEKAGSSRDGYTPFEFNITNYVKPGKNKIKIVVKKDNTLYFDDYRSHSRGIWQDVYIKAYDKAFYNSDLFIQTSLINKSLSLSGTISNVSDKNMSAFIYHTVLDKDQKEVFSTPQQAITLASAGNNTFQSQVQWNTPHLWFPHDPYLYTCVSTIIDKSGRILDATETRFGFREISIDSSRFLMNGQQLFLRGHGGHYMVDLMGTKKYMIAWLSGLKKSGANFLRAHTSPKHRVLYEVADSLGFMIEAEPTFHFRVPSEDSVWRPHLDRLVTSQRNHPSIIFWSASNELRWRGGGEHIGSIRHIQSLDPSRPVFASDFSLESRHGDLIAHHYNPYSVFEEWEEYGPHKPMIWDETGSVWQRDRALSNGSAGFEVTAQDYATGLYADGHNQMWDNISYNLDGKMINGELHQITAYTPWDFGFNFHRWQPTNKFRLMEQIPDNSSQLSGKGIKYKQIQPGGSTINIWDNTLPAFEPNPGWYCFQEFMRPVILLDKEEKYAYYSGSEVKLISKIYYRELRETNRIRFTIKDWQGKIYHENYLAGIFKSGDIIEDFESTITIPDVISGAYTLDRTFMYNDEEIYTISNDIRLHNSGVIEQKNSTLPVECTNSMIQNKLEKKGLNNFDTNSHIIVSSHKDFKPENLQDHARVLVIHQDDSEKEASRTLSNFADDFTSTYSDSVLAIEAYYSKPIITRAYNVQVYMPAGNAKVDYQALTGNVTQFNRLSVNGIFQSGSYVKASVGGTEKFAKIGDIEKSIVFRMSLPPALEMAKKLRNNPFLMDVNYGFVFKNDEGWFLSDTIGRLKVGGQPFNCEIKPGKLDYFACNMEPGGALKITGKARPDVKNITSLGLYIYEAPDLDINLNFMGIRINGSKAPKALIPLHGSKHPALKRLNQQDLSWWEEGAPSLKMKLPQGTNARNILAADMNGTGSCLYEEISGNKIIVHTSLPLLSKAPVADELLSSILEYLDNYQPLPSQKTLYIGGAELAAYLSSTEVVYEHCKNAKAVLKDLDNASHLIIDGKATELLNTLKTDPYASLINNAVSGGLSVLIQNTLPENTGIINELFGLELESGEPYLKERKNCVKAAISWTREGSEQAEKVEYYDDKFLPPPFEYNYSPLLNGIVNQDLFWDEKHMFDNGIYLSDRDPVELHDDYKILISNWNIDWSQPKFGGEYTQMAKDMKRALWFINRDPVLLSVDKGNGQIVFSQLNYASGGDKGYRVWQNLLTNMGISMGTPSSFAPYSLQNKYELFQKERFEQHSLLLEPVYKTITGKPSELDYLYPKDRPRVISKTTPRLKLLSDTHIASYYPELVTAIGGKFVMTENATTIHKGNSTKVAKKMRDMDFRRSTALLSFGIDDLLRNSSGSTTTSVEELKVNTIEILDFVCNDADKVYWLNIPSLADDKYVAGDVEKFNKAMQQLMDQYGVYTVDVHRIIMQNIPSFSEQGFEHLDQDQKELIAKQVAEGLLFFGAQQ